MKPLTFKSPKDIIWFIFIAGMMLVLAVVMLVVAIGDYSYDQESILNSNVWIEHIVTIIARIVFAVLAGFFSFYFWYMMKMLRRSGYFQAMWEHSKKLKHEN